MKIAWTWSAISDLAEARAYIERENPEAAQEIARRIVASANRLEAHPRIGRTGKVRDTRELVVTKTPYILVYQIEGERLKMLRVLHGHQRWP